MRVIESFAAGKTGNPDLNEDMIVLTPDFAGVLDGVTSRRGNTLRGLSTGRFASETLAAAIAALPADIDAFAAFRQLTSVLREATRAAAEAEGRDTSEPTWRDPAAALALYSRNRGEIWRVADPTVWIDGAMHEKTFLQEKVWSELRRAWLHAHLARGMTEDDLRREDPSWDLLIPLISELRVFANYDGPYGYGVLNGADIPEKHIEVFDVSAAREIILASDGYPKVMPTLAESEAYLAQVLAEDPLMYRLHPSVKGIRPGNISFDDRSYLRLSLVAG